MFLFSFALSFAIQKVSSNYLDNRTSYELPIDIELSSRSLVSPRLNADGRNYLDIVQNGYFIKGIYNLRAFFPLFPLLIKSFSLLTNMNAVYSGLFLAAIFSIGSIWLLFEIVRVEFDDTTSFKTVILMLTFPTSYFLFCYYPESLYLFLSLSVFWFLNKKNFFMATLFALLASATRIVGIVLPLIVIFEGFKYFIDTKKIPWIVAFSPLGLIGYSLYNYITIGDPLIYLHSWPVWGKSFSLLGPIKAFLSGFHNLLIGPQPFYDSPFVYLISVFEFGSLVFLIAIILSSYKKVKIIYWLYMVTNAYFYLAGGILQSLPRYILVVFPIYIYLATRLKGIGFVIYNIISIALLVFASALFFRGYWVS